MSDAGVTAADARAALAAQGFSVLVGARLVRFDREEAVLEVDLRPELLQQHGLAHGGVVAYAADNAMAMAAGAHLGPSVVSAALDVQFVEPARGVRIVARARVLHLSARGAVAQCTVSVITGAGEERTCAVAQGRVTASSRATG
jgi:uncharacterized protein (TIGR00369 family)